MQPSGVPIDKLYNLRKREQAFPDFTWKDLHRTACSVAAAVAAVHAKRYVIGNFNKKNILVQPTGLVTFLNTDSFHVSNPRGGSFRGSVGNPEYLAPEIQGKPPAMITLTEEHDRFVLAVIIFRLLMEGTHPFEGSGEPPELAKRIRQGLFPYSLTGNTSVQPPPLSVPFEVLHPEIQQLLHTCFVDGHFHAGRRPQAADWVNALQQAESKLVQCSTNQRHFYVQTQSQCPWCKQNQIIKKKDSLQEQTRSLGKQEQRLLSPIYEEFLQPAAVNQQAQPPPLVQAAPSIRARRIQEDRKRKATPSRYPYTLEDWKDWKELPLLGRIGLIIYCFGASIGMFSIFLSIIITGSKWIALIGGIALLGVPIGFLLLIIEGIIDKIRQLK